eukprot:Rhum_TRINITY_DN13994_c3_g1::Rhum_TRINITY_DN13994_c3_g1_i1::g.66675::m.66675
MPGRYSAAHSDARSRSLAGMLDGPDVYHNGGNGALPVGVSTGKGPPAASAYGRSGAPIHVGEEVVVVPSDYYGSDDAFNGRGGGGGLREQQYSSAPHPSVMAGRISDMDDARRGGGPDDRRETEAALMRLRPSHGHPSAPQAGYGKQPEGGGGGGGGGAGRHITPQPPEAETSAPLSFQAPRDQYERRVSPPRSPRQRPSTQQQQQQHYPPQQQPSRVLGSHGAPVNQAAQRERALLRAKEREAEDRGPSVLRAVTTSHSPFRNRDPYGFQQPLSPLHVGDTSPMMLSTSAYNLPSTMSVSHPPPLPVTPHRDVLVGGEGAGSGVWAHQDARRVSPSREAAQPPPQPAVSLVPVLHRPARVHTPSASNLPREARERAREEQQSQRQLQLRREGSLATVQTPLDPHGATQTILPAPSWRGVREPHQPARGRSRSPLDAPALRGLVSLPAGGVDEDGRESPGGLPVRSPHASAAARPSGVLTPRSPGASVSFADDVAGGSLDDLHQPFNRANRDAGLSLRSLGAGGAQTVVIPAPADVGVPPSPRKGPPGGPTAPLSPRSKGPPDVLGVPPPTHAQSTTLSSPSASGVRGSRGYVSPPTSPRPGAAQPPPPPGPPPPEGVPSTTARSTPVEEDAAPSDPTSVVGFGHGDGFVERQAAPPASRTTEPRSPTKVAAPAPSFGAAGGSGGGGSGGAPEDAAAASPPASPSYGTKTPASKGGPPQASNGGGGGGGAPDSSRDPAFADTQPLLTAENLANASGARQAPRSNRTASVAAASQARPQSAAGEGKKGDGCGCVVM